MFGYDINSHLLLTPYSLLHQEQEDISADDEAEDGFSDKEEDLGAVEEERSVILHLLSQLKLGMDLTRVGQVPRRSSFHTLILSFLLPHQKILRG